MANTDALDIDSCQQVHIANCYFSAADDAICLKTFKAQLFDRSVQFTIVT
jgi:polygalacturonase